MYNGSYRSTLTHTHTHSHVLNCFKNTGFMKNRCCTAQVKTQTTSGAAHQFVKRHLRYFIWMHSFKSSSHRGEEAEAWRNISASVWEIFSLLLSQMFYVFWRGVGFSLTPPVRTETHSVCIKLHSSDGVRTTSETGEVGWETSRHHPTNGQNLDHTVLFDERWKEGERSEVGARLIVRDVNAG